MGYISKFEDLRVWQKSHDLVKRIYSKQEIAFPTNEKYGLESQLKRVLISVPANIAEGSRRQHPKELVQFLNISLGSLSEARYYFLLCKDLGFLSEESYNEIYQECVIIDKMLDSLILRIKQKK
ncbi:MAG: four helix bundle protein [Clostridia bacterium]|jgi:four helix bundle protein|nr:four helix bundle protein [Clostridia bacterium]